MRAWVIALLDPEPIEKGTAGKDKAEIQTPPRFKLPKKFADNPTEGTNSVRGSRNRSLRSASPSKIATPSRKIASPRKRQSKKSAASEDSPATEASNQLNKIMQNGTAASETPDTAVSAEEKVRVEVDESVEKIGDVETTHTTVRVEMPAGSPDLPLPDNAEDMIAQAKEMVEKMREEDGGRPRSSKGKRKAEVLDDTEEDMAVGPVQPAKKVKVIEEEIKKQKVRNRALVGIAAAMAVG